MNYGLVDYSQKKHYRITAVIGIVAFVMLLVLLSTISHAEQLISAHVVRVIDGDTIAVNIKPDDIPRNAEVKHGTIKIRFRGIDAPESKQEFGQEARQYLDKLIYNQQVQLEVKDVDRYGRVVAYVFLHGQNINLEMVKAGYAWAYSQFLDRPYASEFYNAEKTARSNKLGLWQEAKPTPPWEWRNLNR